MKSLPNQSALKRLQNMGAVEHYRIHVMPTDAEYALMLANGMPLSKMLAKHEHDLIEHLTHLGEDVVNDLLWGDDEDSAM